MSISTRTRVLAAIFAVTTGALMLISGPAQAGSGETCWLDSDTGVTQCFADEAALENAIAEQTGAVLVETQSAPSARSAAGTAAVYVVLRFWDGTSYTSTELVITTSNSAVCTSGSGIIANSMPAGWNDRVSSFKTFLSCVTRVYRDTNLGGDFYGYATNAPSLAGLNNQVSSYRLI